MSMPAQRAAQLLVGSFTTGFPPPSPETPFATRASNTSVLVHASAGSTADLRALPFGKKKARSAASAGESRSTSLYLQP